MGQSVPCGGRERKRPFAPRTSYLANHTLHSTYIMQATARTPQSKSAVCLSPNEELHQLSVQSGPWKRQTDAKSATLTRPSLRRQLSSLNDSHRPCLTTFGEEGSTPIACCRRCCRRRAARDPNSGCDGLSDARCNQNTTYEPDTNERGT